MEIPYFLEKTRGTYLIFEKKFPRIDKNWTKTGPPQIVRVRDLVNKCLIIRFGNILALRMRFSMPLDGSHSINAVKSHC